MEIKKSNNGSDLILHSLAKANGGFEVFKQFCREYENGQINELTLSNLYEVLLPLISDPDFKGGQTDGKTVASLSRKYLKGSNPARRPKDKSKHYQKGMNMAFEYIELKDKGISQQDAIEQVAANFNIAFTTARDYINQYLKNARNHIEYTKVKKG